MIPNPVHVSVHSPQLAGQLAALPSTSGIYSLCIPGKPPHFSWCPNLRKRVTRLLDPSYTLLGRIRQSLAQIDCWPVGSKLESALLLHRLVKQNFPNDYMKRLRVRPPHFLALLDGDGFPRFAAVRDLSRHANGTSIWGPFPSRDAAEFYLEQAVSLFQLRRCSETLSPHPDHPGCIYGEMNQCLRPCQAHVGIEEYASEAKRARDFLLTNGKSLTASLSQARARASEEMDFELAAQIHKRIEKVQAASAARDKVVTELNEFNGVALTPGSSPQTLNLWPLWTGFWQEPIALDCAPNSARPRPLDIEIRERLEERLKQPVQESRRIEDLAIFSRWYFSSWREGEWFPFRTLSDLSYRKLVRALSTMAKAQSQE